MRTGKSKYCIENRTCALHPTPHKGLNVTLETQPWSPKIRIKFNCHDIFFFWSVKHTHTKK